MLMRQLEGTMVSPIDLGNAGRYTSMTGWGGIACLNDSWHDACIIVNYEFVDISQTYMRERRHAQSCVKGES